MIKTATLITVVLTTILVLCTALLQCSEPVYTYAKYIIVAKEANPMRFGSGCNMSSYTTLKNINTKLMVIWCGNYGAVGDTVVNKEKLTKKEKAYAIGHTADPKCGHCRSLMAMRPDSSCTIRYSIKPNALLPKVQQ